MTKGEIVQQPSSRFLKVKCLDCENEQIIFGNATTEVKCLKCGKLLEHGMVGKLPVVDNKREELAVSCS